MSGWNIPPLGWCVPCLRIPDPDFMTPFTKRPAEVLWRGTGFCLEHYRGGSDQGLREAARRRRGRSAR